jgi:toxin-antitoxin system PIN domain toxin
MLSFDTNILFHAVHEKSQHHLVAREFIESHQRDTECVLAELVLVELYNLIRNEAVTGKIVSSADAMHLIQALRSNPSWMIVENAPIMSAVWKHAGKRGFARRKIFDVRLALTLQHHGVTTFATTNLKDFQDLGFQKIWNPLK